MQRLLCQNFFGLSKWRVPCCDPSATLWSGQRTLVSGGVSVLWGRLLSGFSLWLLAACRQLKVTGVVPPVKQHLRRSGGVFGRRRSPERRFCAVCLPALPHGDGIPDKSHSCNSFISLLCLIDGSLDQHDLNSWVMLALMKWVVRFRTFNLPAFIKQHQWGGSCLKWACGALLHGWKTRVANCLLRYRIVLFKIKMVHPNLNQHETRIVPYFWVVFNLNLFLVQIYVCINRVCAQNYL